MLNCEFAMKKGEFAMLNCEFATTVEKYLYGEFAVQKGEFAMLNCESAMLNCGFAMQRLGRAGAAPPPKRASRDYERVHRANPDGTLTHNRRGVKLSAAPPGGMAGAPATRP